MSGSSDGVASVFGKEVVVDDEVEVVHLVVEAQIEVLLLLEKNHFRFDLISPFSCQNSVLEVSHHDANYERLSTLIPPILTCLSLPSPYPSKGCPAPPP